MRIAISPLEIQVGDVYQGRRIVYVGSQGDVVYVDFEDGGYKSFSKFGQVEVTRIIQTIENEERIK